MRAETMQGPVERARALLGRGRSWARRMTLRRDGVPRWIVRRMAFRSDRSPRWALRPLFRRSAAAPFFPWMGALTLEDLRNGASRAPIEAQAAHLRGVAARLRASGEPVVMHLLHNLGGGTESHVRFLAGVAAPRARSLAVKLEPLARDGLLCLVTDRPDEPESYVRLELDGTGELVDVADLFGVERIHVHHSFGVTPRLNRFLAAAGRPYDFTAHDFYAICPRINLLKPDGRHCAVVDEAECAACLRQEPRVETTDIVSWRAQGRALLLGAERVICPSVDTATHLGKVVPREYLVVRHDRSDIEPASPQPMDADRALRVAVLGVLAPHKGADYLADVMEECVRQGLPLEVTLIGEPTPAAAERLARLPNLASVTGSYAPIDIDGLIGAAVPDLIFFPARWPETYSYTLSEAIRTGRPILAPRLGAFTERLSGRSWTWLYDHTVTPGEIVEILRRIRDHLAAGRPPTPPAWMAPLAGPAVQGPEFYEEAYP